MSSYRSFGQVIEADKLKGKSIAETMALLNPEWDDIENEPVSVKPVVSMSKQPVADSKVFSITEGNQKVYYPDASYYYAELEKRGDSKQLQANPTCLEITSKSNIVPHQTPVVKKTYSRPSLQSKYAKKISPLNDLKDKNKVFRYADEDMISEWDKNTPLEPSKSNGIKSNLPVEILEKKMIQKSVDKVNEWSEKNDVAAVKKDVKKNSGSIEEDDNAALIDELQHSCLNSPNGFSFEFTKEDFVHMASISKKFVAFVTEFDSFLQKLAKR